MDNVIRVSSHLLHESRDAFHPDKLYRRTFGHGLQISRTTVFFHHQELELQVGEKLASSRNVVGLNARVDDRHGERFGAVYFQTDEMVVSRRIGICELATFEVWRELYLIAFGKADNSVESLSQIWVPAGRI
jgi:hypothetical protein